jgi:hypothetical protein
VLAGETNTADGNYSLAAGNAGSAGGFAGARVFADSSGTGITALAADTFNIQADALRLVDGNEGAGKVLTCDANGSGNWTTPSGDVATDAIFDAAGDLVLGTGADTAARLPIGTSAQVLTSNGTTAAWADASGDVATDAIFDAAGDLVVGTGADAAAKLPIGTEGQLLKIVGGAVAWGTGAAGSGDVGTDVIWDAVGDLALGTGADTAARLPIGTNGQVLTSNGTTAAWAAAAGGGGGLTLTDKTTDANITAVAGEMHVVEMNSGTPFTASRNWTLPVAASVSTGDQFGLMIKDGDAAFEVNVRTGAAGDLLNGVDVSAASNEWELFQAGEVLFITCIDGATGDYIVEHDGRKPCSAKMHRNGTAQTISDAAEDQIEFTTISWESSLRYHGTLEMWHHLRVMSSSCGGLANTNSMPRLHQPQPSSMATQTQTISI